MEEKNKTIDKRARRYIRILDQDKWAEIDKLMAKQKYQNSFNQLINDALDYGLPLLVKAEFGKIKDVVDEYSMDEPTKEKERTLGAENYQQSDELLNNLMILMEEVVLNATINKSLLCSLFNTKNRELKGIPTRSENFENGAFRDTPEYLESYEKRTIREINKRRKLTE